MSRWTEFAEAPASGFRLGMFLKWPDANVGALLGTRAGVDTGGRPVVLVALDFDAEDDGALDTLLRNSPSSPMVKVGRRGETRFYRAPASLKSASFDGPDGRLLDLLCAGRQTVVPPSIHPDTMVYRWTSGPCAIDQLPVLTGDDLDQIREALEICGWKREAVVGNVEQRAPRDFDAFDPFDRAKTAAMANLNAWVPHLPQLYGLRPARGGFEATDASRESGSGRALSQRARNLSIHPLHGCKDFGSGWTGSAIDLVARLCDLDTSEALGWLEDRLGLGDDGSVVIELAKIIDEEAELPAPLRGLGPSTPKPSQPPEALQAPFERTTEVSPPVSQTRVKIVRDIDFDAWRSSRLVGEPPEIQWLIRDAIPLAIPAMVAAQGDAGKSMMLLDAARRVAFGASPLEGPCFGGMVEREGTAVILTAEDDAGSIHRRIANLDPDNARFSAGGERLIVVPLPDAGGPLPLVREGRHGLEVTDEYKRLADKLAAIDDLAMVVFDPLQAFVHAPINEDPAAGQFTCSLLATLAARTQAAVIVAHHTRKPTGDQKKGGVKTLQEAREMVRGTTALVDGLRLVYALWAESDGESRKVCERLGLEYEANRVIRGGVVKANGPVRRRISTFVRNATGLLIDQTMMLSEAPSERQEQMAALAAAVEMGAKVGAPYTRTGQTGFEANKHRLPAVLQALGRDKLLTVAEDALGRGIIVACTAKGSPAAKWLDVPGGPIAEGFGEFALGKARDQKAAA